MRNRYARSNEIGDALFVPMLMAEMAGQLMVHTYELQNPGTIALTLGVGQEGGAFLGKPWEAALEEFVARGIVDENELSRLIADYAQQSKEARRLLLDRIQERVREMLYQQIEEGGTLRDFAEQIRGEADGLGITAQDPHYLETVFRTNVLSAYGAARHRALSHPDVVEARPYRQIRTAGDGRVREEHQQLDGLVFESDGPLADLHPPFGFQCRCSIVSLAEWDGEVVEQLPDGAVSPGFG